MNIVIKKQYLAQKKRSSVMGVRSPTPQPLGHIRSEFLGFQIKHKYKRRVDQEAKRYAVRVLLI